MLKDILKLDGAQELEKKEQKSVNGGGYFCPGYCAYCLPTHAGPGVTIWTCIGWGGPTGNQ